MELTEGVILKDVSVDRFKKYLSSRDVETYIVDPGNLKIVDSGKQLLLNMFEINALLPIRKSFLHKLLRWFNFPLWQLYYLNVETIAAICNDYLMAMNSRNVKIVIENGEALTITSMKYSTFTDIDILELVKDSKIEKVSRDDFITRLYFEENYKTEPIKGDLAGFGLNILNSETGFMPLVCANYIFRYICSNGAVIRSPEKSDKKLYHYNKDRQEFIDYILKQIDVSKSLNNKIVKQVEKSSNVKLYKKIEILQKRLDLITGKSNVIDLSEKLNEDNSIYEAVNYITDHAKKYNPYTRLQLEEYAGSLIVSNN